MRIIGGTLRIGQLLQGEADLICIEQEDGNPLPNRMPAVPTQVAVFAACHPAGKIEYRFAQFEKRSKPAGLLLLIFQNAIIDGIPRFLGP